MTTPSTLDEAVATARQLMADDPQSFKCGYTLENAAIAVAEVYGFDRAEVEARLHAVAGDPHIWPVELAP